MKIKCYRLIAGDVLRYSNGCLIEYYSSSTYSGATYWYSKKKIVPEGSFQAELSMRNRKQEVSNTYFERIAATVRDNLAVLNSQRLRVECFDVPAGSKDRYSSDTLVESIKVNENTCEIEEYSSSKVLFDSSLKSCSHQYAIDQMRFNEIKNKALSMLDPLIGDLTDQPSSKIQIELF